MPKRGLNNCPLGGKCLTESIVYKATVTASDGDVRTYTGLTKHKFKDYNTDATNSNHCTFTKLAEEGPKCKHYE